jgi:hypothetical protein
MKKYSLLSLCISMILGQSLLAQTKTTIKGQVLEGLTGQGLPFANVFLNNTSIGTTTDINGEFELECIFNSEVVVSYIGYESVMFRLQHEHIGKIFQINLQPKETMLNEIKVRAKRGKEWYRNLEIFKLTFLGQSEFAQNCRITNPEILRISRDKETKMLEVFTDEILEIENPSLGYKIHYILKDYKYNLDKQYVSFAGFANFEPMEGPPYKQRDWEKNRQKTYYGSPMHFARALTNKNLANEGFQVFANFEVPNPDRPSEEEITKAKLALEKTTKKNLRKNHHNKILSKANLPATIQVLDTVNWRQHLFQNDDIYKLTFEGDWEIRYTMGDEDPTYLKNKNHKIKSRLGTQTSLISLNKEHVFIAPEGVFIEPLDIFFEGYMGWQKVGDMLPLNYIPMK